MTNLDRDAQDSDAELADLFRALQATFPTLEVRMQMSNFSRAVDLAIYDRQSDRCAIIEAKRPAKRTRTQLSTDEIAQINAYFAGRDSADLRLGL